jgi:hypothetical protein
LSESNFAHFVGNASSGAIRNCSAFSSSSSGLGLRLASSLDCNA